MVPPSAAAAFDSSDGPARPQVRPVAGSHGVALTFESFDPVGRWRDTDHGRPVDAPGEIVGTDVPGKLDGAVELGRKLASSAQVRRCVVTQWWRFASGRVEEPADACALEQIERAFGASGNRVRDLLLATTQSDGFTYRSVTP